MNGYYTVSRCGRGGGRGVLRVIVGDRGTKGV